MQFIWSGILRFLPSSSEEEMGSLTPSWFEQSLIPGFNGVNYPGVFYVVSVGLNDTRHSTQRRDPTGNYSMCLFLICYIHFKSQTLKNKSTNNYFCFFLFIMNSPKIRAFSQSKNNLNPLKHLSNSFKEPDSCMQQNMTQMSQHRDRQVQQSIIYVQKDINKILHYFLL